MSPRQVTVYETQTPDGWDGLGLLTTLERATITQVVQQTVTPAGPTPTLTPATSTSIDQIANTSTPTTQPLSTSQTADLIQTPSSTQPDLSTASIVGIAMGSVVAGILIIVCLLFSLGFRIQRSQWRRHTAPNKAPELRDENPKATSNSGDAYSKAELADAEYTRRLDRLHNGAKPELEGSKLPNSARGFFSTKPVSKKEPWKVAAELGTETSTSGPHELAGDSVLQSRREPGELRDARDSS